MENIYIKKTNDVPYVNFDATTGLLEISGLSIITGNAYQFYEPIITWVDEYIAQPRTFTKLSIYLPIASTDSMKCLSRILKKLSSFSQKGNAVEVVWYFEQEDEDAEETGNDLRSLYPNLPIKLKGVLL